MPPSVAVIGGGPAGLMAAEILSQNGLRVDVYDAMPSVGRKFLMAGKGGMNITHSEPLESFFNRYGSRRQNIQPLLSVFSPDALREWIHKLGIHTFVGSSGRVFPTDMKAAPLLRAWLHRLRAQGVSFHVRHRWLGWDEASALQFDTSEGIKTVSADAVVFALGGASWPQLGSTGAWATVFPQHGVDVAALRSTNCGFDVNWSTYFKAKFVGQPLKGVVANFTDVFGVQHRQQGDCVITEYGIEGGLIYSLSAPLRDAIEANKSVTLMLDLAPGKDEERILGELDHPRGSRSMSSHLQSRVGLKGVQTGLLRECVSQEDFASATRLANAIKSLPIDLIAPRPLAEVISTAGGIKFDAMDSHLMLKKMPGTFCAGEMLDWEAPTGGYLLTACFASGRAAAMGVLAFLK